MIFQIWLKKSEKSTEFQIFYSNYYLKQDSNQIQFRLKVNDIAIVTAKIERMSNKNQNKINMSFYTNAMWFMNTIRKNKIQKSFNKIIQNFKNLFHQKLMKIEKIDKIFAM